MKQLLQTLDNVLTKSAITEGNNRLSMAEQLTVQHYSKPVSLPASPFTAYVVEAETAINQRQVDKRQLMNQYAKIIAERVRLKESTSAKRNKPDVVKLDVPLLIRLLEYAREDAQTDMDLHNVTEKLIEFSTSGNVLTMEYYDAIVGDQKLLPKPGETS